jgi:thiol:disulfide interchange protein DsbD
MRPLNADLTTSVEPADVKPGSVITFSVTAKLKPGYHIYSYAAKKVPPGEPIKTTFDLFETSGLKPEGGWTASHEAEKHKDTNFPDIPFVEYYEDKVTWSIKLRVPDDSAPGAKLIRVQAEYMVCNDKSCATGRWTLPDATVTVAAAGKDPKLVAKASAPATVDKPAAPSGPSSTGMTATPNAPVASSTPAAAPTPSAAAPKMDPAKPVATAAAPIPSAAPAPPVLAAKPAATVAETAKVAPVLLAANEPAPKPTLPAPKEQKVVAATDAAAVSNSTSAPASDAPKVESDIARTARSEGLIPFLLASALGGLFALLMPCVWPMVPITVNFFVKQGHSEGKGHRDTTSLAVTYCLAIIGIFTGVGVLFSFFSSASALQRFANNPWVNFAVAALFLTFGLSLLGLFELRLPSAFLNASAQGESRGGLVGVFFMALTLTITSFTCTFPVVGGLLVMAASGNFLYPIIGLATFSTVLALPFFLLALSPGLLAKLPRSGDWMNSVKVVGGLVEIGAALKFINSAEQGFVTAQNAWFDAQVVLTCWVVISAVCGFYLLGLFRTDHDLDTIKVGPVRMIFAVAFLGLALFMAPALFGRVPESRVWNRIIVGLLPADANEFINEPTTMAAGPAIVEESAVQATSTDPDKAERQQKNVHGVQWGMSFDQALERAKSENKPVLIDFTGVNCSNCRSMETGVFRRKEVVAKLKQFVTVQLYTDIVQIDSITPDERIKRAELNQERLLDLAQDSTNPFYVILSPEGRVIDRIGGYNEPAVFIDFLTKALGKLQGATKVVQSSAPRASASVQP